MVLFVGGGGTGAKTYGVLLHVKYEREVRFVSWSAAIGKWCHVMITIRSPIHFLH